MTIEFCIVTNRAKTKQLVNVLLLQNFNVCWITICNVHATPLVVRSNKHTLVCKFDDIRDSKDKCSVNDNQVRKIKNFILNHQINNKKKFVLVVNCFAGQSRSVAIGEFVNNNMGIPVVFTEPEWNPNVLLLKKLKVKLLTSLFIQDLYFSSKSITKDSNAKTII